MATRRPAPIIRSLPAMREWSRGERRRGKLIGFVPTMGKLHDGHLSLIRAAQGRCDRVVVSIFVNPTQFGPREDFASYPRDLRGDRARCGEAGVDVIFAPPVSAMYPRTPLAHVAVPALQGALCGRTRPEHFPGVCLVVTKLLNIVLPHELFLGQKDAQQATILARLIRDLDFDVRVRVVPTVRERDGLALSSRNAYLSPRERAYAPRLSQALRLARRLIREGEPRSSRVIEKMRAHLADGPGRIDYIEIVDPDSLHPISRIEGEVLVALAVFVGKARLIDNLRARPARKAAGGSARREVIR